MTSTWPQPTQPHPEQPAVPQLGVYRQSGSVSPHPGWVPRCLIWLAVALYIVPPLISAALTVLVPMLVILSAQLTTGVRTLLIFVGAAALILAKNTSWVRRIVAAVLFVIPWLIALVVTPLLSSASGPSSSGPSDTIRVLVGLILLFSITYVAWNIVRNRRWWILLLSVVWAAIFAVVQNLMFLTMSSFGMSYLLMTTIMVAVSLPLVLGGFGVFHLLGRIRGAAVPPHGSSTYFAGAHRPVHVHPAHLRAGQYPGYRDA